MVCNKNCEKKCWWWNCMIWENLVKEWVISRDELTKVLALQKILRNALKTLFTDFDREKFKQISWLDIKLFLKIYWRFVYPFLKEILFSLWDVLSVVLPEANKRKNKIDVEKCFKNIIANKIKNELIVLIKKDLVFDKEQFEHILSQLESDLVEIDFTVLQKNIVWKVVQNVLKWTQIFEKDIFVKWTFKILKSNQSNKNVPGFDFYFDMETWEFYFWFSKNNSITEKFIIKYLKSISCD